MNHDIGLERYVQATRNKVQEQLYILSRAVQQSPNALLIARADGVVEYVNPSFTRLTGYEAAEVVGENPTARPFDAGPSQRLCHLWSTLREGREWRGEVRDRRKNGEEYWAQETITPIANAGGEVTHYLILRQDITQQRQDRLALEESEARFRQVAEMSGEWLWEQDPEGRYIYSSAAVEDILGFKPDQIIGRRYLEFIKSEDRGRLESELADPVKGRDRFYRLVNRYRHRDGHEVFTESTGGAVFDEHGQVVKWRGVDHNVTARKRYEDALRLRDRAIEAASVGITIADAQAGGDYPNIYVNPALTRITGYTRDELLNSSMRLLQGPGTDKDAINRVRHALLEGHSCEVVLQNYRKDGSLFWNELLISPVRDAAGEVTHFVGILADVTERRRAEEERRELEIARRIQTTLFPKGPLIRPDVIVAGSCVPANEVGGDYFDYFCAGDVVDAVIADVSGHSVGAAMIMTAARSVIRTAANRPIHDRTRPDVATVMRGLNAQLFADLDGAELFITLFYLRYDPVAGTLCYANAGHPNALLLKAGAAECTALDADGLIFGVKSDVIFEQRCAVLKPGDSVLLYTDGLTESQNDAGEFFGVARLTDSWLNHRDKPAAAAIDAILGDVRVFLGDKACVDDVTLLLLQRPV